MFDKSNTKKVIALYGSSLLSIIIGLFVSIFNARVLGPTDFGNYKYIETVARLIASIVSVGLFISITRLLALNQNKIQERNYLGLFTIVFVGTSFIGIFLILIFSIFQPAIFSVDLGPVFRKYFFIVPAIIGHFALNEILKGLQKIYMLALFGLLPALCYLIIVTVLEKYFTIDLEMVLLLYFGILLTTVCTIIIILKPKLNWNKNILKELWSENQFNGKQVYFGSLAGVATTHLAGISISYFLNNEQVGYYMLSLTICSPLLIIPSVLGTTFFKNFVTLSKIPVRIFSISLVISGLALILFYIFIDQLVILFYSKEFLPVAYISKILILAFILHGLGDLINRFLGAKGLGTQLRNSAFIVGIINVFGYSFLIMHFGILGAILTKIIASGLYFCVMLYYYNNFKSNHYNV